MSNKTAANIPIHVNAGHTIRIAAEPMPRPAFSKVSVGIATRYQLDGPGIESRLGERFSAPVQTAPGAHPASCIMGTGSFPGVKRPGRGVDHPPPSSAEVEGRVELYLYSAQGLRSLF